MQAEGIMPLEKVLPQAASIADDFKRPPEKVDCVQLDDRPAKRLKSNTEALGDDVTKKEIIEILYDEEDDEVELLEVSC